jgi:ATP-dependent RNA helicase RhlE
LRNPARISIGISSPAHTVSHALYPVPQHLKRSMVTELLKETNTESVLIFTRTKHRARRLDHQLKQAGYSVTSLHSNRTQGQRQNALKGFKSGQYQIMVATDIAARGLDVESISHVINFDMPDTADAYIHRIGRTGRAERTGDAFTLVSPDDEDMVRKLEKIMNQKMKRLFIEGFNYDVPAPPRQATRPPREKRPSSSPSRKNAPRSKNRSDRRP